MFNDAVNLLDPVDEQSVRPQAKATHPYLLEAFYLLFMALSGSVSVTISYTIDELSENCKDSAVSLGIVFLSEALGALVGGAASVWAYHHFHGNVVLVVVGFLLGALLICLPFITNSKVLNLAYFGLGTLTVMLQIGCIHLVRILQKKGAGHWLSLSQACVSFGAGFFLLLDYAADLSLLGDYLVLCVLLWLLSLVFVAVPFSVEEENDPFFMRQNDYSTSSPPQSAVNPINNSAAPNEESVEESPASEPEKPVRVSAPHYYVELLVGVATSLINGVNLSISAYLTSYASDTGVESKNVAEYQLVVFWCAMGVGRLIGSYDQKHRINNNNILPTYSLWMLTACGACFIWLIFWEYAAGVWIGTILLGLFVGPGIGYAFDWVHRITISSEASTTFLILTTFAGGHTVVYICAALWDAGLGPRTLIVCTITVLFLSIPFTWAGRNVSYLSAINPSAEQLYGRIANHD